MQWLSQEKLMMLWVYWSFLLVFFSTYLLICYEDCIYCHQWPPSSLPSYSTYVQGNHVCFQEKLLWAGDAEGIRSSLIYEGLLREEEKCWRFILWPDQRGKFDSVTYVSLNYKGRKRTRDTVWFLKATAHKFELLPTHFDHNIEVIMIWQRCFYCSGSDKTSFRTHLGQTHKVIKICQVA